MMKRQQLVEFPPTMTVTELIDKQLVPMAACRNALS